MAVQAQYPSNILLLNRNGQEGKNTIANDYSLQSQPGGILDQSQMLINNGVGSNPRKRGRETVMGGGSGGGAGAGASAGAGAGGGASAGAAPINWFSLQPQPSAPTFINLAQLHNHHHQPTGVSTGLRLAFGEQQQQQQGLLLPSSFLSSSSYPLLSDDLTSQIKQQRDEIDQFLQAQGEQLRRTLADRRDRHYRALLGAAEESATRRLREKELEVQKAARRNAELEERLGQLRAEAQVWQSKARAQEVTAASLQAQLQQAMMHGGAQDKRDEGTMLGCAGVAGGDAEDAESAHVDPERVVSLSCSSAAGPVCRACRTRAASVVLLPCRHLSLCTDCNVVVDACPRCATRRTTGVEVFLS